MGGDRLRACDGPELTPEDLDWKRKRRVEEEDDEGWKCDEEEYEDPVKHESTESRDAGWRRRTLRRGLFPSDFRVQGNVNKGPLSGETPTQKMQRGQYFFYMHMKNCE